MTSNEPGAHDSSSDRARLSDPVEFRRLFDAYFEELARYAYRYVQSIDEAKDLVHDAFFRLWRQREALDYDTSVRAYLFTVVRNLALDHVRRQGVDQRWRRSVTAEAGNALSIAPDDPDRDLARRDIASAVRDAVATLPARQREVFLLRWHRQASYGDIARALGISPKTVEIHVSRALAHLRHALRPLLDPTAPTEDSPKRAK